MLQQFRSAAKYIWIIIVVAFIGGFLIYETSGLVGRAPVTTSTIVAKVNGEEIPYLAWMNASASLAQQREQELGRGLTLDERQALDGQAFDQLVGDVLLRQEYEKRGIRVTDQEVIEAARFAPPPQMAQNPELQTDGRFDPQKYQRLLSSPLAKSSGLLAQLESYYRTEIPRQKLLAQVAGQVYPSDARLFASYRDQYDSVDVSFVALRPAPAAPASVPDAEVKAYYDSHAADFERPARAVLSLVSISRVPSAADTALALAKARTLRAEIAAGAAFADVAKRESADSVSGADGGSLGRGPRGRFVEEFEKAAWALKAGELSQPVVTPFGIHLIKVDARQGDTLTLRHLLVRVAQGDSSAVQTDRKADRLAAIAGSQEEPARLDSAAKELGLVLSQVVVNEGSPAVWGGRRVPSVSAWAFTGTVVGETSDLFDDESAYYLARLDSLTPAGQAPLSLVQGEIRTLLARRKALDAEMATGEALARAAATSGLEAAAAAQQRSVERTGLFTRTGSPAGFPALSEATGAAFRLPVGQVSRAIRTDEAVIVLRVDKRVEATKEGFALVKTLQRQQVERQIRERAVQLFLENLRKAATVDDRRKAVQAAQRRQGA